MVRGIALLLAVVLGATACVSTPVTPLRGQDRFDVQRDRWACTREATKAATKPVEVSPGVAAIGVMVLLAQIALVASSGKCVGCDTAGSSMTRVDEGEKRAAYAACMERRGYRVADQPE